MTSTLSSAPTSTIVTIEYTNWKGARAKRKIDPINMYFGKTEHHQDPQWLLRAYDLDKKDYRNFAMKDIHSWETAVNEVK